jgi:signal peptidase I
VIAVVLAFLFRGFVAEAFVIPTGSMAPTLQGRHIDMECPECGYQYQAGASEENDQKGEVRKTYCPVCRFSVVLDSDRDPNHGSFNGDRILVSKFAYEIGNPERWDVFVFKFPENAKQNYIKRLVGLPNELIRIRHGDIFAAPWLFDLAPEAVPSDDAQVVTPALRQAFADAGRPLSDEATLEAIPASERPLAFDTQMVRSMWWVVDGGGGRYLIRGPHRRVPHRLIPDEDKPAQVFAEPRIVRKPPDKVRPLLQLVHDTKYPSKSLTDVGWPSRWRDEDEAPLWQAIDERRFSVEGAADRWAWLRYRNIFPSESEWETVLEDKKLPVALERPEGELISDHYAYNDRITTSRDRLTGSHWVGDLALECELEVTSNQGEIALDLVEAGVHFRCLINIASGQATLTRSDGEPFTGNDRAADVNPTAKTSVRGAGDYSLRFVNADDQLRLWVDDELINFDGPTTYEGNRDARPRWSPSDPGDLSPVAVGARGASVRIDRLKVLRDIYYLAIVEDFRSDYNLAPSEGQIHRIFRTPREWDENNLFDSRRTAEFVIGPEQYFPMGDNSPQSQDGRLWNFEPYFDRDMLIGKAILIYWPHAWRRPIPFLPNFARMKLIR